MILRREAALRLNIPIEMAQRHGLGTWVSEADLAAIESDPPAWLAQSRANRTGKKPVWVRLECDVCGIGESVRPKKWWPKFTFISCEHHSIHDLAEPVQGHVRREFDGIGSRFIGILDEVPEPAAPETPADAPDQPSS